MPEETTTPSEGTGSVNVEQVASGVKAVTVTGPAASAESATATADAPVPATVDAPAEATVDTPVDTADNLGDTSGSMGDAPDESVGAKPSEVAIDNEAAESAAAQVRDAGVPPAIIVGAPPTREPYYGDTYEHKLVTIDRLDDKAALDDLRAVIADLGANGFRVVSSVSAHGSALIILSR